MFKIRRFSADGQEYCSEIHNHESCGDIAVLDCSEFPEEDLQPILRVEVEMEEIDRAIEHLFKKTISDVQMNDCTGECLKLTVEVRAGCVLSPIPITTFLKRKCLMLWKTMMESYA